MATNPPPVAAGEFIKAAGGVVIRRRGENLDVVLVHRRRHEDEVPDEWTLPKGKLQRDEGYEAAAEREVREETGHRVRCGPFLGASSYMVGGRPKVVLYWVMESIEEGDPTDRD